MLEKLIAHIEPICSLAAAEIDALSEKVRLKKLRRRQYLLQEGDICRCYNFVLKGCLRMYQVDVKGTEHILQFAQEDGWITDISSFHRQLPSKLFIDALEPSEVLQIQQADLIQLYIQFPKFDRYFRVLVENAFVKMQERVLQNISSSAEARYRSFLQEYPALANRISQVQIAAFIGVTPEFLSKIRQQLKSG
ncbi:MAG: Crp/Fnr family transcriptional regulator [Saprospiraceae bacterium]|nr:Crp/Fnr family transcriptional regulator [Lewinellaceae bacterium]